VVTRNNNNSNDNVASSNYKSSKNDPNLIGILAALKRNHEEKNFSTSFNGPVEAHDLNDGSDTKSVSGKSVLQIEEEFIQRYRNKNESDKEEDEGEDEEDNCSDYDVDDNDLDYSSLDDETLSKTCSSSKSIKSQKRTDFKMKEFAINGSICLTAQCNPKQCSFGGNCVCDSTIGAIQNMRKDFWGSNSLDNFPISSTRKALCIEILRTAYRRSTDTFEFCVTNKSSNNRLVCEAGFLILIGLSNSPNASDAPRQWRQCKNYIQKGSYSRHDQNYIDKTLEKVDGHHSQKFSDAATFIVHFANNLGDDLPGPEGMN